MSSTFPYPATLGDLPEDVAAVRHIDTGRLMYRCPERCWKEHHKEWRRSRDPGKLEPFPWGHLMFERPLDYGSVDARREPTEDERLRAYRSVVLGMLHGWLSGLPKEKADAIINATIKAKMEGKDVGASPWRAALMCQMEEVA